MATSHQTRGAPADRARLVNMAVRLEWLTIAWMVIEAAVACSAALAAHSIALMAFGIDSLIELASAAVLIWRLSVELQQGGDFPERTERAAARIAGGLLFALALYVIAAALWALFTRTGESFSWAGLVVALLAMPIMAFLARRKLTLAERLGSRALRADAIEAVTCGWLSAIVVIDLLLQAVLDAWWIDPLLSLAIVWLLVKEGREAWADDACCG
jgi:divalent metal cation (Fe/Co/Zn/Cd) transporter